MPMTMVVMERGSEWPGHVGNPTHVVAFGRGQDDLCRRACDSLSVLQRNNTQVRVAVLACNDSTGHFERLALARALLSAVRLSSRGRLVLCATASATEAHLRDLFALADTLTLEARGSGATVSLRFNRATRSAMARASERARA